MSEIKVQSHNVDPTSYRLTSFSLHVNRPWHSWDTASTKCDLENARSRSWVRPKSKATKWVWLSIDSNTFRSMLIGLLGTNVVSYLICSLTEWHPSASSCSFHDDVIKWKHFPRSWPFVRGIQRSTVNSPHKGQWRGALMFSLICTWINGWVNNREAGDWRRHGAHDDVVVMVVWVKSNWHRS